MQLDLETLADRGFHLSEKDAATLKPILSSAMDRAMDSSQVGLDYFEEDGQIIDGTVINVSPLGYGSFSRTYISVVRPDEFYFQQMLAQDPELRKSYDQLEEEIDSLARKQRVNQAWEQLLEQQPDLQKKSDELQEELQKRKRENRSRNK